MTIMRSRTGDPGSDPLMSDRDHLVLREFDARNGDIGSVAEFAKQLDLTTANTRATLLRLRDRGYVQPLGGRSAKCPG